ncbi:unnamed protein product [Parnassius apollo]|uniref:(apollo) hypothetical protein n=1 Tax=Parnassius apollo TaxID=110799 RepID=A0A8S3XCX8_PARAO|nr:unnamed protein product [Parnassius apollo]
MITMQRSTRLLDPSEPRICLFDISSHVNGSLVEIAMDDEAIQNHLNLNVSEFEDDDGDDDIDNVITIDLRAENVNRTIQQNRLLILKVSLLFQVLRFLILLLREGGAYSVEVAVVVEEFLRFLEQVVEEEVHLVGDCTSKWKLKITRILAMTMDNLEKTKNSLDLNALDQLYRFPAPVQELMVHSICRRLEKFKTGAEDQDITRKAQLYPRSATFTCA